MMYVLQQLYHHNKKREGWGWSEIKLFYRRDLNSRSSESGVLTMDHGAIAV